MTVDATMAAQTMDTLPSNYDQLAEEVPLSIAVNNVAIAVMVMSPSDFEDFITGYFLSEGIVHTLLEIKDITISQMDFGYAAQVSVTGRREHQLKHRRMRMVTASCGMCNKTAMEHAFPPLVTSQAPRAREHGNLSQIRALFSSQQTFMNKAGAMHAAMYVDEQRNVVLCSEDIGRHNALDKVIGKAIRAGINPQVGVLAVTSRCGVELVQKAVMCGFSALCCLSSPTTLAVDIARKAGLQLIYLPRNNQPIIYDEQVPYES